VAARAEDEAPGFCRAGGGRVKPRTATAHNRGWLQRGQRRHHAAVISDAARVRKRCVSRGVGRGRETL
jgi:hypothetical protein